MHVAALGLHDALVIVDAVERRDIRIAWKRLRSGFTALRSAPSFVSVRSMSLSNRRWR
jgi:hypothetical protein